MGRYADSYEDKSLRLTDQQLARWSATAVIDERLEARCDAYLVVTWAASVPRRLGGEATGKELSVDKRALRALGYLYARSIGRWAHLDERQVELPEIESADPDQRRRGAQIQVEEFITEMVSRGEREVALDCTVALQSNMRRMANKFSATHEWEISELRRILGRYNESTPAKG